MIIDCHGHYTTAPAALQRFRDAQIARLKDPGAPIAHSSGELERCVRELGFVGCNLNPDPSSGHWTSPPLTDRGWYPNVFFDTFVYHQAGIDLLARVIDVDNILFGSEMIGAVSAGSTPRPGSTSTTPSAISMGCQCPRSTSRGSSRRTRAVSFRASMRFCRQRVAEPTWPAVARRRARAGDG